MATFIFSDSELILSDMVKSASRTFVIDSSQPGKASITVVSKNIRNNSEIKGYFTTLYDRNQQEMATGFTPVTFQNLDVGERYFVTVADFQEASFAKWSDGQTERLKEVPALPANGITLTALYNIDMVEPPPPPPPPSGNMGTIIFAYFGFDPNNTVWKRIFAAKAQYPKVNFIVVANPSNGTEPRHPNVKAMADACHARGINVIGYIGTGFGAGSGRVGYVRQQAAAYKESANLDGVFLDETDGCGSCSNPGGAYQQMADFCHNNLRMKYVVGNPGGACNHWNQHKYFDIVTMWEDPSVFSIDSMRTCAVPKAQRAAIPHSQSTKNLDKISRALDYVSYYYEITQNNAWHLYSAFPPWFEDIIRIVNEKLSNK